MIFMHSQRLQPGPEVAQPLIPQASNLIRDDVWRCVRVMQVAAAAQGQH